MKKITWGLSLALILIQTLTPFRAGATYNPDTAKKYLLTKTTSPWTVLGLKALNANPASLDNLKNVADTPNDYSTAILALTSSGKDPRTFAATDYVAKLKTYYVGGQLGDASTLNDDIFGLLALVSSGESKTSEHVAGIKNYLFSKQQPNGGWGFMVDGSSDSNMTAAAITALTASGVLGTDTHIQKALEYLKTTQNADGGFTYDPLSSYGNASDASSTAWVMWALNALNIQPSTWSKGGKNPTQYLESLQTESGYFKYQSASNEDAFSAITTSYAAIALSGKTLPLAIYGSGSQNVNAAVRIEGGQEPLCSVTVPGPTALEALKNAATACNLVITIKETGFGPYLSAIGSETSQGMTGWMYLVNNISPDVGAADYRLHEGDSVLWYYGDFGWLPSKLTLSAQEIQSGKSAAATVEEFSQNQWKPAAGATVFYGAQTRVTDENGKVTITPSDGYYALYAQKTGSIRSNSLMLKVGNPSSGSVTLSANAGSGEVLGENTNQPQSSISFTVSPNGLAFGTITAGSSVSKELQIANTGTQAITVEAVVSGDPLFTGNLLLQNTGWRKFHTDITAGQNKNVQATLSVPAGTALTAGQKNGTLIFWAKTN